MKRPALKHAKHLVLLFLQPRKLMLKRKRNKYRQIFLIIFQESTEGSILLTRYAVYNSGDLFVLE